MKKLCIGVLLIASCLALYAFGRGKPSQLQQALAQGDIIRLHVVAASDDTADQETKLLVRDAVLAACGPALSQAKDRAEMEKILRDGLCSIEAIAQDAALQCGYGGPVAAFYGTYPFPERVYAGESVPAGDYDALRIVLGDGMGANWWCVMYPPLCFVGEEAVAPGEKIVVTYDSIIAKWLKSLRSDPAPS